MVGLFHGKPHLEMDDDWGYPYFRKPSVEVFPFFSGTKAHPQETLGRSLAESFRALGRAPKIAACPQALAQPMPMRVEIAEAGNCLIST